MNRVPLRGLRWIQTIPSITSVASLENCPLALHIYRNGKTKLFRQRAPNGQSLQSDLLSWPKCTNPNALSQRRVRGRSTPSSGDDRSIYPSPWPPSGIDGPFNTTVTKRKISNLHELRACFLVDVRVPKGANFWFVKCCCCCAKRVTRTKGEFIIPAEG